MRSPDGAPAGGAVPVPVWPLELDGHERRTLREVAHASNGHGLRYGRPIDVDPRAFPERLRAPHAAFVSLHRNGALRGCIGSLEACRPLVEEVALQSFAAAFRDPRFPPLRPEECRDLDLRISVLGPLQPLHAPSREALLAQLRPGRDGLLISDGPRRATFLPAVWKSLPDPRRFLAELEHKAGRAGLPWTPGCRAWRYEVLEV